MSRWKQPNRGPRRTKTARWAIALALIAATVAALCLVADDETEVPILAPEFTLPNLDGTEISLADYLGKVVILDFWASWCAPCTRVLPDIHALEEAYADRGLVLLVLCFDKDPEDARTYLVENGYATENVLWGSLNDARAVRDLFGVEAVTHTLVIGPQGYIRYSGHPEKLTADVVEPWLPAELVVDPSENSEDS